MLMLFTRKPRQCFYSHDQSVWFSLDFIKIQAGAADVVQYDIRVNPKTHRFLNIDQVMFGFHSAYTLQHRDLIKQWLSIYMSASSATEINAMVNVDLGSRGGPLTRSAQTSNLKWGGFDGLIQNGINLAGNLKMGLATPNIIGSVNHFPSQGGGLGGGNKAGNPNFSSLDSRSGTCNGPRPCLETNLQGLHIHGHTARFLSMGVTVLVGRWTFPVVPKLQCGCDLHFEPIFRGRILKKVRASGLKLCVVV